MTQFMLSDPGMSDAISKACVYQSAGTYRLHAVEADGSYTTLPRLLAPDAEGVLYIDASSDIPSRVANLKRSMSAAYTSLGGHAQGKPSYRNPGAHQAGKKVVVIGHSFVKHFPYDRLCVSIELNKPDTSVNHRHVTIENRLFYEYRNRFGELPALNG